MNFTAYLPKWARARRDAYWSSWTFREGSGSLFGFELAPPPVGVPTVGSGDFRFGKPRYFDMLDDGQLVERDGPAPVDPNAPKFTVTRIDRDAGTITLEGKP